MTFTSPIPCIAENTDREQANADFSRWTTEGKRGYWFTIACGHFVYQVWVTRSR